MNHYEVAHRFCNQDFGKHGHLTAGNVRVSGRDYYSYNTVFGQWVDLKKKVCLVYWGGTSTSSSKHQLRENEFPNDVNIFPYNDKFRGGSYYSWNGCYLVHYLTEDSDFTLNHRLTLIDYYVDCMYNSFHTIVNGKSKGLDVVSFDNWEYVNKLCRLYKDTSIDVWLKNRADDDELKVKKCMVKLLRKGERNVEKITDAMFGKGTFKRYHDYCERYRKADESKNKVVRLAHYLGYCSPYGRDYGFYGIGCPYTAKQLRELTAKERVEIKFANIQKKKEFSEQRERNEKYRRNKANAYRYIVGEEPVFESSWSSGYKQVEDCHNRFNGEWYCLKNNGYSPTYASWCDHYIYFDFDNYRLSEDKEQWMREFYAKCKQIEFNIIAQDILMRINANKTGKYSWDKRYIDDDYLKRWTTESEYEICKKYIELQEKHYADEEARERAEALRRQREEEERQREKELQEKIKAEQIEKCVAEGDEGCRNLWRLHYMSIENAKSYSKLNEDEFFNGGNVLMRFSMDKDIVETSMHIRLDIPTCKKFFKLINIWHENPEKFVECEINTHYSGTYKIRSFNNDILVAGCHRIAYAEMKRMYDEILTLEKAV